MLPLRPCDLRVCYFIAIKVYTLGHSIVPIALYFAMLRPRITVITDKMWARWGGTLGKALRLQEEPHGITNVQDRVQQLLLKGSVSAPAQPGAVVPQRGGSSQGGATTDAALKVEPRWDHAGHIPVHGYAMAAKPQLQGVPCSSSSIGHEHPCGRCAQVHLCTLYSVHSACDCTAIKKQWCLFIA